MNTTGVSFIEVQHDEGCPCKLSWDIDDCICEPEMVIHQDAGRHFALVELTRQQRRKAERDAAKAMRRAGGAKP